jgi:hypothetical protein
MSDFLTNIGSFLSTHSKGINSLLGLAGLGTNLYSGIQNIQSQNQAKQAQSYVTNLLENPTKLSAATAAYTQPLAAGLQGDIANQVQGTLAEQGLSASPAAYTTSLTQALAPYLLQQQQTGQSTLMSALNSLLSTKATTSPFANISQLLAALKSGNNTASNPLQIANMFDDQQPQGPGLLSTTDPSLSFGS